MGGTYIIAGENHGQSYFRRTAPVAEVDVVLYYWDDQTEESERGWWFGPYLGSDEVWAHHPGVEGKDGPPFHGWQLLFTDDGLVDADFVVIDCSPAGVSRARPVRAVDFGEEGCVFPPSPTPGSPAERSRSLSPIKMTFNETQQDGKNLEGCDFHSTVSKVATPQSQSDKSDNLQVPEDLQSMQFDEAPDCQSIWEPLDGLEDLKRKREESQSERELQLRKWLMGLDDGVGAMLQYYDVLASEFEADLTQIAAVKNLPKDDDDGPLRSLTESVDPIFWETVQVKKLGHRMLFARGISHLP